MKFLLSLCVLLISVSAQAAETYSFDKAHTRIMFEVNHLGFSNQIGEFNDFDGSLILDREAPENSKVDVTIQTSSIDLNNHEKWNEHMRSADFFDVDQFPTMSFKTTKVEPTGDNTAKVTGDLTLLGVTNPVVLDVTHNKSGKSPHGDDYKAGFSASGMLKRSDFGMEYGLPGVGDDVKLIIEAEAVRQDEGSE